MKLILSSISQVLFKLSTKNLLCIALWTFLVQKGAIFGQKATKWKCLDMKYGPFFHFSMSFQIVITQLGYSSMYHMVGRIAEMLPVLLKFSNYEKTTNKKTRQSVYYSA